MNIPFAKVPSSFIDTLRYIKKPAEFLPLISRSTAVQTVSFVGMIIQRDLLRKNIHNIHDELFLYFDDLYFGYQLTLDGEEIRYSPEVVFSHDVSFGGSASFPNGRFITFVEILFWRREFFRELPFLAVSQSFCG